MAAAVYGNYFAVLRQSRKLIFPMATMAKPAVQENERRSFAMYLIIKLDVIDGSHATHWLTALDWFFGWLPSGDTEHRKYRCQYH